MVIAAITCRDAGAPVGGLRHADTLFAPRDSLEEQSRCRELAQVSSVLEELSFSVLLFFLGVCDCGEHPENCH